MAQRALTLVAFAAAQLLACNHPSSPATPGPEGAASPAAGPTESPTEDPLESAAPLAFSYLDYNWEIGGHQAAVRVEPAGRVTVILATASVEDGVLTPRWHQLSWEATEAEREALRDELMAIDFFGLDARYENPDIADGAQTTYAVAVGAHEHRVHCANLYPPSLQRLTRFVRERFVTPRRAALEAAPPMTRDEARSAWADW